MIPTRATTEQALAVDCPDCDARPGAPCVYLPLSADIDVRFVRSPKVAERILLTGTPTQRPHNGRYGRAWDIMRRRAQSSRRQEAARLRVSNAASPELRAVARAHQAWDRQEWLRLAVWLRRWGHILTCPPSVTKEP